MVQKPKAVKYKVIAGYLLLFSIAVVSVWFVYTEILRIAKTGQAGDDNQKIIKISNTIADLYASEAIGRSSILTGSASDYKAYTKLLDTISRDVKTIKESVEESQRGKFDSIQMLINRKKNSVTEIIAYRRDFANENTFSSAINGIYNVKDSIKSKVKPVRSSKRYQWNTLVNSLLTPKQLDSLSKLPVSNDSLAMAFDKVLTNLLIKDNKLKYQLYRKEQKLLEENRIISDQLRVILTSVENEFLQNSYSKINESQLEISKTIKTMAWVAAITFLILIVFAWLIIRDLSINQNYRKQLELLNNENQDLLRSKSMLMATVTHDLQTPLGSIIGFHDLINDSGVNPKQKKYLANIKESANYILKLVNDLLDFSKLENNRITIEQASFNFKTLIENTCNALEPIAANKNIELNWDIEDTLNRNFLSDPYRIKQVLTNLVSNAVKFTNEGSVEVTARIEHGKIHMSVLDTGIGIAHEKHGDVFKEFTQAHAGIEKKFGGTGLGLTISKKIIELLDGNIMLESKEGQGSIFTIILPCVECSIEPKKPKQRTNKLPEILTNKKFLIIDDDMVQLMLMKELFSGYNVAAQTEINSSAAISILENGNFDMVLTDIQMPVLDGFELVALIRNHTNPAIASLPVIALSGKRDLTPEDFKSKGFTANHPKPVQLDTLLSLLAEVFREQVVLFNTENDEASKKLFNLRSLSQFTYDDNVALKNIINTFITSANENCEALKTAAKNDDKEALGATAHKMIPMLKQMEVHTIANLLLPIEDGTLSMDHDETIIYIDNVCLKIAQLIDGLIEEVN